MNISIRFLNSLPAHFVCFFTVLFSRRLATPDFKHTGHCEMLGRDSHKDGTDGVAATAVNVLIWQQ